MRSKARFITQKITLLFGALILLAGMLIIGCSEARLSSLSMVDDQGNHPGGWTSGHPSFAVPDAALCTDCHGDSLGGGITDTSCLQSVCHHDTISAWATTPDITHGDSAKKRRSGSSGFLSCQVCHGSGFDGGLASVSCLNAACHGTPVATDPPHPTSWRTGDTYFHTDTNADNASICAVCHTDGANSPIPPPSPPAAPGTAPGCFNDTLCHGVETGAPHPTNPYDSHPADAVAEFSTYCNTCHSIDPPSPYAPAPVCTSCHAGGSPLANTNCTSCHAKPPDSAAPVGAVAPNIEGAHTEHNALAGVTGSCNICHDGGGTGTGLLHYYDNTVNMATSDATYDANAGAAVLSTTTCANVSCHGGITTPAWATSTIDVATECTQCHQAGSAVGVPEDNSYYSGEHTKHVTNEGVPCTDCHNVSADANHLNTLDTSAMEGPVVIELPPDGIVWDSINRRCSGICHFNGKDENHNNKNW